MHRTQKYLQRISFPADAPLQQRDVNLSSITLVLPAWNEAEAIARAMFEAVIALQSITDDYEVIIVDDGSTDKTTEIVRLAQANPHVRLIEHGTNRGYGAALRSGFQAATKDYVVFTDADNQFDLTELDRLAFLSKRYDIVCGYRMDRKDSSLRCFYSRVYNVLVDILLKTGVRDVDCALKMFRREVIQNLEITTDGFLVNSELLTQARQKNYSIVEVGVSHRPRLEGTSTVSIAHIPKVLTSLIRYWWNAVQFPTVAKSETQLLSIAADKSSRYMQYSLLFVAAIFMLTNLSYPLIDRDETRYAEIPREILVTGNWMLPQLNFETYYDKPPLLYWLCAASYSLFGISEWSARLVPALAALGTLAATMWFGSRMFDKRTGLIAGGVLMLSIGFAFSSRYLLIDGVLSLLVTLSLFTGYMAINPSRKEKNSVDLRWWLLCAICCGLGFLTKGPIALVLFLPPIFAFAWLTPTYAKPRWWHYALLGCTAGCVAAPWLIAVSLQDADFLPEFLYRHNLKRFAGEFHAKPIWFFIPVLLVAGHPWSFLTIPLTRFFLSRDAHSRLHRPPVLGYLVLWSAWCFAFFSISKCKLPTYLLPAAPALALIAAHYLNQILKEPSNSNNFWLARRWSARSATTTTCVVGLVLSSYLLWSQLTPSLVSVGLILIWASLLLGSLFMLFSDRLTTRAWSASAITASLLAVMVMHLAVPAYSRHETIFGPTSALAQKIKVTPETAIATISHEFSEVPYYLNRNDVHNLKGHTTADLREFIEDHPSTILVVTHQTTDESIQKCTPLGTLITPLGERGPAKLIRVEAPVLRAQIPYQNKKKLLSNRRSAREASI